MTQDQSGNATYRDLAIPRIDTPKVPLWDEPPGIRLM